MTSRRLLINTMVNMRELGGYAAPDGGVTKFRRFIRSDAPANLTDKDISFLLDYGVRHVFDLRWEDEAAAKPCSLRGVQGISYRNMPFTDDKSIFGDFLFFPQRDYVPIMQGQNRAAEILSAMAECGGTVLFHCSAGKDRTGIIAAFLLMLSGVPEEDVIADYQVTFTYIKKTVKSLIINSGRPIELCRSDAEWLEPFLEFIAERGGAEIYLKNAGLTDEHIIKLRNKMLAD